jgi:hypothetical protein
MGDDVPDKRKRIAEKNRRAQQAFRFRQKVGYDASKAFGHCLSHVEDLGDCGCLRRCEPLGHGRASDKSAGHFPATSHSRSVAQKAFGILVSCLCAIEIVA